MKLSVVQSELIAAKPYFKAMNPGITSAFAFRPSLALKALGLSYKAATMGYKYHTGKKTAAELVGDLIGGRIVSRSIRPVKSVVSRVHVDSQYIIHDRSRKNGVGGRSWISHTGHRDMVVVYHDANRAGPHVDVHIGRLSLIYRVKPETYAQLKYNNQGMLTENSKKLLMDHVRAEIANGSRVPQNIDHSMSNARAEWTYGDRDGKAYGDGFTRQVISTSTVDVYKTGRDHPIEFYAPVLDPRRTMYIYKLYPGDGKKAPICIWGLKSQKPPKLEDRLHLKLTHPEDFDPNDEKLDFWTSTAKYDGSSCYIHITPKGTTVWSPRQSVVTGEQIEYTFKLDGIAATYSDESIVGMGEVLFKQKDHFWSKPHEYLPCATGSGILNSNAVLPKNVKPEIRLYRIDKVGRTTTKDLPFWENRKLQEQAAALNPDKIKVVELMDPQDAQWYGYEGVVVVPTGGSVNDGLKVKWWMDPHDWRIDKVDFKAGDKGGMAGVVRCTSLESGKTFNLGPGQIGDRATTNHMMANPSLYEGSVIKVNSRHGHEGRASKMISFHDDKGVFAA